MRHVAFILLSVFCCLTGQGSPFDREGEQSAYHPIVLSSKQVAGKDFPEYEFNARETDAQGRIRGTIAIRQNGKAKQYAFTVAGAADSDGFMPLSVRRKGREEEEAWSVRVRGDILNLQMPGLDRPVAMKRVPALTVLTPAKPKVVLPNNRSHQGIDLKPDVESGMERDETIISEESGARSENVWTDKALPWIAAFLFLLPLVLSRLCCSRFSVLVAVFALTGVLLACTLYDSSFWMFYAAAWGILMVLACIPTKKQEFDMDILSHVQRVPMQRTKAGQSETSVSDDMVMPRTITVTEDTVRGVMMEDIRHSSKNKLEEILRDGIGTYLENSLRHIGDIGHDVHPGDTVEMEGDVRQVVRDLLSMMDKRCLVLLQHYQDNDFNPTPIVRIRKKIAVLSRTRW